ncbi:SAM-dependent methyltransferase [Gordonia sp. L191]|uniref:SAM-dependent methyltransferase n=1 Tax=Gordonia sp. L191 TaxID=2982699 RepID=UPI0024BFA188|nr:SAM-dependent methyltransferase [Gordonia sp. L191]WHU49591.1 SAM-dependent methyltransferase [Gordonia sp. L191]
MIDLDAVGQTALGVAYVRAYESLRRDALFTDPLAVALFESAVTDPDGTLLPMPPVTDAAGRERRGMYHWIVARTLFLDDLFGSAARDGIEQFVILGSGLDARAFRLDLGPAAVVYELDRPPVVEVKEALVAEHGLLATTGRRVVQADLITDWLPTLIEAGLRTDEPTCWLAEGLLVYLEPEIARRVIDTIGAASAPGSRVGVTVRSTRRTSTDGPFAQVAALWHEDPGIAGRFADTGWTCELTDTVSVLAAAGRAIDAELAGPGTVDDGSPRPSASLLAGRYASRSVGRAD